MRAAELKAELRRLFSLAFPLAAAEAGTQLMSVVDMAVVGRLGGVELAAVGLGNAVYFGVSVFGLGLMLGVDPLISQAVGAGDHVRARRVMWQGIWLALITAAGLTLILLGGPFLLHAIGVNGGSQQLSPPGNLIEHRPAGRVGIPTAPQSTAEVGIFPPLALPAGRLGTVDLAAHQLVITLASFTFTTALGVATAGSVRVGLAVGARDQHAARLAGHAAFIGAALVMSVGALLFIASPSLLARLLTN